MNAEQWLGLAFLSVAVAGAVYTYYDLKRTQLVDYRETIQQLGQHVLFRLDDLASLLLVLPRVPRPPSPTWTVARRIWAWLHGERLYVAVVLLYDRERIVTDVRLHWQMASNATQMFNEISKTYGTLIDPMNEKRESWVSWHQPETGCVVWVEAVYPRLNFFWRKNA